MTNVDLKSIESWCRVAAKTLSPGVPEAIHDMTMEVIDKNSGKPALVRIADDLAEGISHLPADKRDEAQRILKERCGIGYEYFLKGRLRTISSILKRGKITSSSQYEAALEYASDTTHDPGELDQISRILSDYVAKLDSK
ncbi:hypothetical protein [Luteimonas aquatica]|uniref:hypothetical protein n=1 Tax=Luteimonas aquatica TaxID=450364 RepID=UPI001F59888A|nr:hypothetical protein [Luteimonas aquatica]